MTERICTVPECDRPLAKRRRHYCCMHYARMLRHGSLDAVFKTGPKRRDGDIHPETAHGRVKSDRGSASLQLCVDCGGTAQDWSYNHMDPSERHSERGPFSLDTSFYEPRCRKCHKQFDMDYRRSRGLPLRAKKGARL